MSDLATKTAAPIAVDSLPGHVLSPWSIADIAEAEQEFEQTHLRTVSKGAADAQTSVQVQMIQEAQSSVACGAFAWGSLGFWTRTLVAQHLPFLLHLSLRAKQPRITREAAAVLITPDNVRDLQNAVRQCAGYKPPNVGGATTTAGAQNSATPRPSPGETSSASSPTEASALTNPST